MITDLDKIKVSIKEYQDEAEKILEGSRDMYDGADGARYILDICEMCEKLFKMIEEK
jgi:hypothetical protein